MKYSLCLLTAFALLIPSFSHAAYTIKDGKLINTQELATLSVQEHYSLALDAYQKNNWRELVRQSSIVIKNFPSTPFALDAYFYLGVGYFHLQELDFANKQFTAYLKKQTAPKFFEQAIQYKYWIAEKYEKGAKRRVLGMESMPKWMPAHEEAKLIYDEVVTALPHHELAVQSLFGKATLQFIDEDYKASIETYQTLIRRFPKHPLACESYISIEKVYLTQCQQEYADPDFLDLAEITVRKFRQDFPNEPRIGEAEALVLQMKEEYAKDLYETARFYERTKKANASVIYYSKIVSKYPDTHTAELSRKRLAVIEGKQKKERSS